MSASERVQSRSDPPGPEGAGSDRGSKAPVAPREAILRAVRQVVAPLVRADGGEVHVVSVDDGGVTLHLSGRYSGCPGNTLARRRVIEPLIAGVAPGAIVTISSGPLIPAGADSVDGR